MPTKVPPPDSDLMESMTDEQIKLWALNDLKKIFNKGKKIKGEEK